MHGALCLNPRKHGNADVEKAGLLTCSDAYRLPGPGASGIEAYAVELELTAAGLSGIRTRFPIKPTLSRRGTFFSRKNTKKSPLHKKEQGTIDIEKFATPDSSGR